MMPTQSRHIFPVIFAAGLLLAGWLLSLRIARIEDALETEHRINRPLREYIAKVNGARLEE